MADTIIQRPIPRTGESLPVIGLGTWQTFDVGKGQSAREPLKAVLRDFVRLHGKVIDSSPMYGNSESVVGDLGDGARRAEAVVSGDEGVDQRSSTPASAQWRIHSGACAPEVMDLMQVHNLVDWQLRTSRDSGAGRSKARFATSADTLRRALYDQLGRVVLASRRAWTSSSSIIPIVERDAERRLSPLAADKRIAVLVNRPFAAGGLFSKLRGRAPSPWAKEIGCASWAQFLFKIRRSRIPPSPAPSRRRARCGVSASSRQDGHLGSLRDAGMRERIARSVGDLSGCSRFNVPGSKGVLAECEDMRSSRARDKL